MVLLLTVSLFASVAARAVSTGGSKKYTYVIVHGATAGGWEWKKVGKFLTADGETVYRLTLTGLGERMHLNSPDVSLQTHIDDVVNTILFEDLHDIVLVGHSYGGMVITGVMDRIPERIHHVIFLDAAVPEDGQSLWDHLGSNPHDPRFADGFMPVPWVKADAKPPHNVNQSIKCFNQRVSYKNPAAKVLPVTFVGFMVKGRLLEERARTDQSWKNAAARGWTMRTFPGSHVAHLENPRGLSTLLEEAVNDQNKAVGERPATASAP
jgi:pimeloyl-ACP methyl ester carboxylesterase